MKIRTRWIWFFLIIISLLAVSFPRFNRHDVGPIKMLTGDPSNFKDSDEYVAYVKYFRKEITHKELRLPFAYRPFVPFISSLLPFSPMTSLNIINLASLLISVFILYRLLMACGIPFFYSIGGCFMFILSFPIFYYGTVGYVDPVLILFLILCAYFIISEKKALLIITFLTGCLVKETIIIIIPVFFVYNYLRKSRWKLSFIILLFSYFGVMLIVRVIFAEKGQLFWHPSFNRLISNISRPRAWISNILAFGVPGLLFLTLSVKNGWRKVVSTKPVFYSLTTGFFMSLLLTVFAALSAYLDGRYIWTSYPFSIPLSLLLMSKKGINQAKIHGK